MFFPAILPPPDGLPSWAWLVASIVSVLFGGGVVAVIVRGMYHKRLIEAKAMEARANAAQTIVESANVLLNPLYERIRYLEKQVKHQAREIHECREDRTEIHLDMTEVKRVLEVFRSRLLRAGLSTEMEGT